MMGGGEEGWVMKIETEKIKDYEVGRLFFDIYRHLAKMDDEADRSCSM